MKSVSSALSERDITLGKCTVAKYSVSSTSSCTSSLDIILLISLGLKLCFCESLPPAPILTKGIFALYKSIMLFIYQFISFIFVFIVLFNYLVFYLNIY